MSATPEGGGHPGPEVLHAYGLGRLEPSQSSRVEQHLLNCPSCCQVLKETPPDSFIALLRQAQPGEKKRPTPSAAAPPRGVDPRAVQVPRLAGAWPSWGWWAAALVLLIVIAIIVYSLN